MAGAAGLSHSVTEQWAVATLSGPAAKDILTAAGVDIDLANDAFPFMSMKKGHVSGLPARLFRISFTGELSYEINVPARMAQPLVNINEGRRTFRPDPIWDRSYACAAGRKGLYYRWSGNRWTVTPLDLGMDWIVSKTKTDFIGKRALERSQWLTRSENSWLAC